MELKVSASHKKTLDIIMFFALFGTSIVGAEVFSISLNKIAILPLILFLFINCRKFSINRVNKYHLIWYIVCIISIFIGCMRINIDLYHFGYTNSLINYLISIFCFYFPLLLLLPNYYYQDELCDSFNRMLILTCRIQMVWAIAQFILYNTIKFDLNNVVLVQMLGGLGIHSWTFILWDFGHPVLKITGLNAEGACLGYYLLLGIIFDKNKLLKIAYIITILISMQRSAFIGLFIIIIYYVFFIKENRQKLLSKKVLEYIIFLIVFLVFFYYIKNQIPVINDYFNKLVQRFDFINNNEGDLSTSSSRHILYIPYSIITLVGIDPLVTLFGIGPRASGVALAMNIENLPELNLNAHMLRDVWAVECDFAEILLGSGLFGTFACYYNYIFNYKSNDIDFKLYIVLLILIGFMYDFSHLTITHLLLMFAYLNKKSYSNKKTNNK